ncbi:sensor histidine kinase [Chondromyces apiculatus]|uniref:histidine kinase n=1 Tax=Chondromyces apiculatus DSM 436 TaxID=1192034 RepID=A0A017T606_9BACT|nr:HAMP domain-containing sensor histidine kinase [Chondromyces apiculatus]EYF04693.1 Hypothetical protein CAP_4168 [Chondromyces apiculatus DSM 436]
MPFSVLRRVRSRLALRIYLAGLAQFGAVILGFTLLVRVLSPGPRVFEVRRDARLATSLVAAQLGDGDALTRELARVRDFLHAELTLHDDTGAVLASTDDLPPPEAMLPPERPFWPPERGFRPPEGATPPPGMPRSPDAPRQETFSPQQHGRHPFDGALHHGPPPPPPGAVRGDDITVVLRLPDGRTGRAVYTPLVPGNPGPPRHHIVLIVALVLIIVGVASLLTARSLARPLARLSQAVRALGAGHLETRVALARTDEIGEVAAAFDEMADRLTALLRAERELLANISHELRTPLARIRVALDIAAEGDAEVARQSLRDITEDLGELERLISDVLTAARLDLGQQSGAPGIPPLRHEHLDTRELLDRSMARFRSAHSERPLVVDLPPDLPALDGDPVLLRRAVDNLLDNAHKYSSRPDDPVTLRASTTSTEILIEVADEGIGISPEDMPKIFRPFFRTDRSRTRSTGGLGLGLALARRIVEAHHGTITLDSAPGKGTRASVRLPCAPLSVGRRPPESARAPTSKA